MLYLTTMATKAPSQAKYREMILFFLEHIPRETMGKLKLMKLLYYAEFDHFEKYKKPMLGETYLRWDKGPMPKRAEAILKSMESKKLVRVKTEKLPAPYHDRKMYVACKEFNPKQFLPEEIETLHHVAEKWQKHTGTEMRNASHGDPPWVATPKNKAIDYNLVFYRNTYGEMDSDDL